VTLGIPGDIGGGIRFASLHKNIGSFGGPNRSHPIISCFESLNLGRVTTILIGLIFGDLYPSIGSGISIASPNATIRKAFFLAELGVFGLRVIDLIAKGIGVGTY